MLASVSIVILTLTVVLLPSVGILAVGIAAVAAETIVAMALLIRPSWWLPGGLPWAPLSRFGRLLEWRTAAPDRCSSPPP